MDGGDRPGKAGGAALVVIDVQNDFCPGGALAVPGGDGVVAPVNRLIAAHDTVVLTQDWHGAGHSSLAVNHPGMNAFDTVMMPYGRQTLWPVHCVQGTAGADFHADLDTRRAQLVIRKGFRDHIDSYSAFFENDRRTPTGLSGYLRDRGIGGVVLAGLALDFCVAFSALDAVVAGFRVSVVTAACRALDLDGSCDAMMTAMREAGVTLDHSPP